MSKTASFFCFYFKIIHIFAIQIIPFKNYLKTYVKTDIICHLRLSVDVVLDNQGIADRWQRRSECLQLPET